MGRSSAEQIARLDGRTGEGGGGDSPYGVHLNLVIGVRGRPTAAAATAVMARPAHGFVPFLACAGPGVMIRPATVIVNRAPLVSGGAEKLFWGAVQLGIGEAVLGAVAEGLFPARRVDELVLLTPVWLDLVPGDAVIGPEAETLVRAAANRAMTAAIADALAPLTGKRLAPLVAGRSAICNGFYTGA